MELEGSFSGIVQVTDLDDFILPSQQCIKPLIGSKDKVAGGSWPNTPTSGLVDVRSRKNDEVKKKQTAVSISLNDCLACSGCVTSAETVLIQQQSHKELAAALLALNRKRVVITISPQSKASLGVRYGLSLYDVEHKLQHCLKKLGADYVLDSNFGRSFSLLAAQKEFVNRWRDASQSGRNGKLPLLASTCPGWICYAEKTHGAWILPFVSCVRSPQAVMGALVKNYLAEIMAVSPSEIYHVSVMPCFDKKLEASRSDFLIAGADIREVDCVISTGELDLFLKENDVDLSRIEAAPASERQFSCLDENGHPISHEGSGSGGYAHHVLIHAAQEIFGYTDGQTSSMTCTIQNSRDLEVTALVNEQEEVLLRVAVANGFRNIQNIVQKIKRNKCSFDYVEIMACPSGCLNGGGQIAGRSIKERRETLAKVAELYGSAPRRKPLDCTGDVLESWLGTLDSEKAAQMLYSGHRAIEKDFLTSVATSW